MCGISGIYSLSGTSVNKALLDKMTYTMKHRGPDGSGSFISEGIGLGHRRLSIIDLAGGDQPISNEDETIQIVFNGEIYNFIELREELKAKGHSFKTFSDTEVVIHAYEEWGNDCVLRLNGIFAFALWNSRNRSLFLARDHLGVKPLYYIRQDDKLIFASEIKSLLQDKDVPREVDMKSLGELFTFRYVPSPNTLFKNIKKLPPGHWMSCSHNNIHINRYWNWMPRIIEKRRESELIEAYQNLLKDSIKLQMRSDVPVGLFLSSGIDSGAILAIMSGYVAAPIYTFTIGFEGGERTNETDDARQMATRFGANHTEMIVGSKDYEDYYNRYMWDIEEPVGNETAAAFYFVSKIASEKVKVALTGQGADELWAGYHRHLGVKLSTIYSHLPEAVAEYLNKFIHMLPRGQMLKRGVTALHETDLLTRFAKIYSFYSAEMKNNLFQDWVKEEICMNGYQSKGGLMSVYKNMRGLDPISQMLYIDTRTNLPDDLLMVNDKMSMANSIEARVPFLDYRLVEFIETIPANLKLKGIRGKYLHKKALEKWLPRKIIERKKKGFANPINNWLRSKMSYFVDDCLLNEKSSVNKYFNKTYINKLIRLHKEGKEDYMRHIYLLISFELWHRQFIDKSGGL